GLKTWDGAVLKRIKTEVLPAGVTVQRDSLCVPLRSQDDGGYASMYKTFVFLVAIEPATNKEDKPRAFVRIHDIRNESVQIGPGDILVIGTQGHKVLHIVPA